MAVNAPQLADEVAAALGYDTTSTQLIGWATGILEELTQNGIATFGFTPSGHTISGMTPASMASKIANYAGYGSVSTELLNYCTGIVNHIHGTAIVTYIGPPFPPPPPPGWYLGGTISAINGAGMASMVAAAVGYPGVSAQLLAKCTAICDHIIANALVVSGVIS